MKFMELSSFAVREDSALKCMDSVTQVESQKKEIYYQS